MQFVLFAITKSCASTIIAALGKYSTMSCMALIRISDSDTWDSGCGFFRKKIQSKVAATIAKPIAAKISKADTIKE